MQWSPTTNSIWGKLEPDGSGWMPLPRHLEHAAHTAGQVWDEFVPRSLKRHLVDITGLSETDVRDLLQFYAGVHDVGKASPTFSCQAPPTSSSILDRMRDYGMETPLPRTVPHIRHEVVSQISVSQWLTERGVPARIAHSWSCVVGGHHGRNPSPSQVKEAMQSPDAVGTGVWAVARTEMISGMAALTGVTDRLPQWATTRLPVTAQTLFTGLVVVADWMASDQARFPYSDEASTAIRALEAFNSLAIPRPWGALSDSPDADDLLQVRFPHLAGQSARPLQQSLVDAARQCPTPPLLIVEGPMGIGKTEAAMLAAEVLAARFGQGGVFFGLPTMATANPMFTRTLAWLSNTLGEDDASVALAHGKAALNDDFSGLISQLWRGHVYDEDDPAGHALVNGWLRGRRRSGLASFVVGTIDQALFAGLKAKYVVLRHLGLAGKVVVIDEVHAADAYMRTYLKRVLTWLAAYGTPVILMSATLPPAQRDEFITAYAEGRGDFRPSPTSADDLYPRLAVYDGRTSDIVVASSTQQQTVTLSRIEDDPAELAARLAELLGDGGTAAVLCNTVSRAQEAFHVLQEQFGDQVELLHSRFLAPERAQRERHLVERLGPNSDNRPHRLIVVGTQVLEQSLDIDFDIMVSDLAPVDLVLQRMGRLHRHTSTHRPSRLLEPQLLLRGVEDWDLSPPVPVRGSRTVYGTSALLRAATVLDEPSVTLPTDIAQLVRRAYSPDLEPPAGWETAWADAEAKAARESGAAQHRASTYLLAPVWEPSDLTGLVDLKADDPERAEEQGRSQVRDSEDSIEVIAVWQAEDGTLRLPNCAPHHPGALLPTVTLWGSAEESLARAMAACTLPLPKMMTTEQEIDHVISALECAVDGSAWQSSHWVAGQLVLPFDHRNSARVGDFSLHYGPQGLSVSRAKEHE